MAKTLLLADDSVTIQRVIELTFAHEDVRVVAVADGKRAVEYISVERPDIVVADVGVAEVDGFGIVAHMKKSAALRDIPVLLLAGAFEPVDEGRVRASGCDGILVKPFEPQQLVGRVKELLAERRGKNGKDNGKDKGKERNGKRVFGALGIGGLKLKLHRACVGQLFDNTEQVLDAEEIYALAKKMA